MARVFNAYVIPNNNAHQNATASTAMSFAAPNGDNSNGTGTGRAAFVSVTTNDVYVTFDGSTPSSTNGLVVKAGINPWFFPVGSNCTIKALPVTGSATVNVAWLA